MKRRFLVSLLACLALVFGVIGLSACDFLETDSTDNSTPIESVLPDDSSSQKPHPEPVTNISFEEFMRDYSDLALSFADEYVKDDLLDNKTPLSQTWGFHANDENELDSVSLTYTYSSLDTKRILEVANATFTEPIDLDKIVAGEVSASDTLNQITRETAFEFDAKTSYLKQDFASTLFNFVSTSDNTIKYFSEIESENERLRNFRIAEQTSDTIYVYNLLVVGKTDAEVIENLNVSYNYNLSEYASYPLGDDQSVTISTENYQLEEFPPENVEEAIKDYNAEITNALDTHFLTQAGKDSFGNSFNPSKLQYHYWDIGDGETISEVKFVGLYDKYQDATAYSVLTVTLKKPIVVRELTKQNIETIFAENAESSYYLQNYFFSYDPAKQNDRNDLVNAIFEAYGMSKECPEGAIRYYIDDGDHLDSVMHAETRTFNVVEIHEDKVTEFTIAILDSSTDEEYIQKLTNSSNYRIYNEKSCEMNGKKVYSENEATSQISSLADEQETNLT